LLIANKDGIYAKSNSYFIKERSTSQSKILAQYEMTLPSKPISFTSTYNKSPTFVMPIPHKIVAKSKAKLEVYFKAGKLRPQ